MSTHAQKYVHADQCQQDLREALWLRRRKNLGLELPLTTAWKAKPEYLKEVRFQAAHASLDLHRSLREHNSPLRKRLP